MSKTCWWRDKGLSEQDNFAVESKGGGLRRELRLG